MLKKIIKSAAAIMCAASLLCASVLPAYAAQTVRIVIDGQELIPTDANGNVVEPVIINGTTYLPVRAVANAFDKAVYWDGPNFTVYLGDMEGELDYPTVRIDEVDNIGNELGELDIDKLTDNYGNSYSYAHSGQAPRYMSSDKTFQALLDMKYSRFKCVLYAPKGCTSNRTARVSIVTDGKVVYTSPEISKTSRPIDVDVDITGCNEFEIRFTGDDAKLGYIAEAGFYQ